MNEQTKSLKQNIKHSYNKCTELMSGTGMRSSASHALNLQAKMFNTWQNSLGVSLRHDVIFEFNDQALSWSYFST